MPLAVFGSINCIYFLLNRLCCFLSHFLFVLLSFYSTARFVAVALLRFWNCIHVLLSGPKGWISYPVNTVQSPELWVSETSWCILHKDPKAGRWRSTARKHTGGRLLFTAYGKQAAGTPVHSQSATAMRVLHFKWEILTLFCCFYFSINQLLCLYFQCPVLFDLWCWHSETQSTLVMPLCAGRYGMSKLLFNERKSDQSRVLL